MKIKEVFPRVIAKAAIPAFLMIPAFAYAAEEAPSLGAALVQLLSLVKDKASAAVIVVCVIQILRTNEVIGILGKLGLQGKTMKVAVAVLTAFGYVANAYVTNGNLGAALIEGLFTAGGAMLIFESFKSTVENISEKKDEAVLAALIKKKSGMA